MFSGTLDYKEFFNIFLDLQVLSGTLDYKEFFNNLSLDGASATKRLSSSKFDGGKAFSQTKNGK